MEKELNEILETIKNTNDGLPNNNMIDSERYKNENERNITT